jgi:hypothetical protein
MGARLQRVLRLCEQVVEVLVVQFQVAHAHHGRPLCRTHLCEKIEQRSRDDTRLVASTLSSRTPHHNEFSGALMASALANRAQRESSVATEALPNK